VALGSALAELNYVASPLQWLLPKGLSQNVVAVAESSLAPEHRAVLVGHLDSHRTPWLFGSRARVVLFTVIVLLSILGGAANMVLYVLGAFTDWAWVFPVTLWPTVILCAVGLLFLQADTTPFTVGANDNASAVGVVLHIAHLLKEHPLLQTEVWVLLSGAEEVGCWGMKDFLRRHQDELSGAAFINFEAVGVGETHYTSREGMTFPYASSDRLMELAATIASRHPDWHSQPRVLGAGYTETGLVLQRGYEGITLIGLDEAGFLPHWHQVSDVLDNLEPEALDQAARIGWEILQEIDRTRDQQPG
jgi:hypothetical protein